LTGGAAVVAATGVVAGDSVIGGVVGSYTVSAALYVHQALRSK